jgi:hypothetical protein
MPIFDQSAHEARAEARIENNRWWMGIQQCEDCYRDFDAQELKNFLCSDCRDKREKEE